jgi:cytochrome c5
MKFKNSYLCLIAIALYSCGPSKATIAKTELEKLVAKQNAGKEIYENNCAKCHELTDPKRFSIQGWQPILKTMQFKARLQDADMDKINAYLASKQFASVLLEK